MKLLNYLAFMLPFVSYSQIGIGTDNPRTTLDVNGDFTLRETLPLTGDEINSLYIDEDGLVGIAPTTSNISTKVFSAIEENTNIINSNLVLNNFNNGYTQSIDLTKSSIKINTLGIESLGNNLLFIEDGNYLINLSINFIISLNNSVNKAFIVGAIEIKKPEENSWKAISTARIIEDDKGLRQIGRPMIFPAQVKNINKGTEMRIVFYRANYNNTLMGFPLDYLSVQTSFDILKGISLTINRL